MEVHAHTHTPRKKWTHYFWEFLMLFLAVFCGFLAENLREHYVEHQRELQYVRSMIEDLKSDTTALTVHKNTRQLRVEMIDSLILLLRSPDLRGNGNAIYFFGRRISTPINFFPNDRTIQQLKSSGALRLIRNIKVSNSIMSYDREMRQQLLEQTDEIESRSEYRQRASKIFDGEVFHDIIKPGEFVRPSNNPQLFSSDKAMVNELIMMAQYMEKANQIQISRAKELIEQAKELMALIRQEYHLN